MPRPALLQSVSNERQNARCGASGVLAVEKHQPVSERVISDDRMRIIRPRRRPLHRRHFLQAVQFHHHLPLPCRR